jgi:antibiotic biosynthesis monooxygenase (ABM) superfamily enzyme
MITVYVKHYLNEAGRTYFDKTWFPYVFSIITKQPGYHFIETHNDDSDPDCKNITFKFDDQKTLDDWIAHPDHQKVIDDLNPYRTKHYNVFHTAENTPAPDDIKEWQTIVL